MTDQERAVLELADLISRVAPVSAAAAAEAQRRLDGKTKPRRSLGRIEDLVCQLAAVRPGEAVPAAPLAKAIVVMAADHGVAEEGVSAYPQEVTAQMVLNFERGGAAINVLARQAGARLVVVDMGVKSPLSATATSSPSDPVSSNAIRSHRIRGATDNFTRGPAMSHAEARAALAAGAALAEELAASGVRLIGIGEMGIGNTTAASAVSACLCAAPPEEVTGRGTGVDDAALRHKVGVVRRALDANRPDPKDALDVLAKVGGFEIAGLAGVVLGAAASRVAVLMDGFIASTAALVAARLAPAATGYLIASHRSVEAGHRLVLQALATKPLLDLELRLGEGTGAALAMPLVDAAAAIMNDMATFAAAGVSDAGA